jgi:hypothetical protein
MEYENDTADKYRNIFPGYTHTLEGRLYLPVEEGALEVFEATGIRREEDPIERLFSGKSKTLKATVRELLNEIDLREGLNSSLFSKVDEEICKTKTYLLEINGVCQRRYGVEELQFGRRRTQLEDRLVRLEQEKRQEEKEFWKDAMFLKKYLMSALADYWETVGRENLFKPVSIGLDYKENDDEI